MNKKYFEEMREENLLDAAIIREMDLSPEEFVAISAVLQSLT